MHFPASEVPKAGPFGSHFGYPGLQWLLIVQYDCPHLLQCFALVFIFVLQA